MHCSNLNGHLAGLHVIDDPTCICLSGAEDNKLGNFTLEILLYGDDNLDNEQNCIIFQAVHDYIMDSGRFY